MNRLIILLLITASLSGCNQLENITLDETNPPFFVGQIIKKDKSIVFDNVIWVEGVLDYSGNKYIFGINNETLLVDSNGKELSYNNLRKRQIVMTWIPEGADMLNTNPRQVYAQQIIVLE